MCVLTNASVDFISPRTMEQFASVVFIAEETVICLVYIFLLVLGDQRKYSEKSEICICLDPCILKRFLLFGPQFGLISVFLQAVLLKLEITVSFLWLLLPVHLGSLKRIYFSKLYSLTHNLLLNVISAL